MCRLFFESVSYLFDFIKKNIVFFVLFSHFPYAWDLHSLLAISKMAALATAMTVPKGVAKDIFYFKACWCSDLAIAANSDMALIPTNKSCSTYLHQPLWARYSIMLHWIFLFSGWIRSWVVSTLYNIVRWPDWLTTVLLHDFLTSQLNYNNYLTSVIEQTWNKV